MNESTSESLTSCPTTSSRFSISLTFLLSSLLLSSLFSYPTWADSPQKEDSGYNYLLEIPNGIKALPDHRTQVEVPILFQNKGKGPHDVLRIGLDYEELLLQFNGADVEIDGAAGLDVETLHHNPEKGRLDLEVVFDPFKAIDQKVPLVRLLFNVTTFSSLNPGEEYELQKNASVKIISDSTYVVQSDKQIDPEPNPDVTFETRDGSVTIFLKDHVEVHSAEISPDPQRFKIPVSVTHLKRSSESFTMSLNYSSPDLTLIDVSARAGSMASSVEWEDQFHLDGITVPALVTVRFQQGIFESMNEEHLIDLHFAYTPPESESRTDILYVTPQWGFGNIQLDPHWLQAFGFDDHEQLERTPTTTGIISVAPRKFLRGDANSSYSIEVEDALTILKATFYSGIVDIQCQRAADSNNDGKIGISDSVQLLTYLYAGGAPPEAPFPFIDVDYSDSPLSCEFYGPPSFELVTD